MDKLKISFVLVFLFVFSSFVSVSDAGTGDVWEQCTTQGDTAPANDPTHICCSTSSGFQWFPGTVCPSITVTTPNGGERWIIGSIQTISWTSSGSITNVKVELSRDNGVTYTTLFDNIPNDGSESWTVTSPETVNARVRISVPNLVSDISNNKFTISLPQLTGTVTANVQGNPVISGATVTIKQGNTQIGSVTTDIQGHYGINLQPGTYDMTASATGYTAKTVTGVQIVTGQDKIQDFSLTPICPAPSGASCSTTSSSITLSWNSVFGATQYSVTKCDSNGQNCDGGSATTTTSKTYSSLSSGTQYTFKVKVNNSDGTCTAPSAETQKICTTSEPPCVYELSMVNLAKTNTAQGKEKWWDIVIQDSSSQTCNSPITYTVSSVTKSGGCNVFSDIYNYQTRVASSANKKSFPITLTVGKGNGLNAFTIYAKTTTSNSCTLSFNFVDPNGDTVDPSFTIIPPNIPDQSPHVSLFDFSGDLSVFNAEWEAFYPDNNPEREMNVKCGLNCDPRVTDCSAITGKGCLPYDAPQGTGEIKKSGCGVSLPTYDFSQTNQIMCLFYDPANAALNTFVNHDFTPIDFEIRSSEKITTTVGQKVDLKVDIHNKGTLTDSYTVTSSSSGTVDISPNSASTASISPDGIITISLSVTPLVDQSNLITITATSNTQPSIKVTKEIEISPELFALPEFGVFGLLQILAIATVLYFLLTRTSNLKKGKRRK